MPGKAGETPGSYNGRMADAVRIDKWLWAARFFKTRSLAQQAVAGGKVHLDGQRVKPARDVRPGDRLTITKGEIHFEVVVDAVSARRGPAREAETLYTETESSREARERARAARREKPPAPDRRPDKRERRRLQKFKEGKF